MIDWCPFGAFGVRGAAEHATGRPAHKIDEDVVVLDAAVRVVAKPIQDVDNGTNVDLETRFLAHLTNDCRFKRLAELNGSARQAPLAFERLMTALDQQDAIAV